jgi:hypothetical protein
MDLREWGFFCHLLCSSLAGAEGIEGNCFWAFPAAGRSGGQAFRLYACEALGARPVFASILNAMRRKFCVFCPLNNKARRIARRCPLFYIWLL